MPTQTQDIYIKLPHNYTLLLGKCFFFYFKNISIGKVKQDMTKETLRDYNWDNVWTFGHGLVYYTMRNKTGTKRKQPQMSF